MRKRKGKDALLGITDAMYKVLKKIKGLFVIIHKENALLIALCVLISIVYGVATPVFVWISGKVFDIGLEVAQKRITFNEYIPYLVLFCICSIIPQLIRIILQSYIVPKSELIFRTSFKGEMLQKLKKMRYENLELPNSVEIIDKAYSRAEEAALHIFPSYFFRLISSSIAVVGSLFLFCTVRWWFFAALLLPFLLDTYFSTKNQFNIYNEMETYWSKEHCYKKLGDMLKTRNCVMDHNLFGSAEYLINTYKERLHERNKEFEKFYFKNLKHHFWEQNIIKIGQMSNALLLLLIYIQGGIAIGQLISLTIAIFSSVSNGLENLGSVIKQISYQAKFYEYYERYFELSDDDEGDIDKIPNSVSIEFCDVSFSYPGSDKQILSHLSFYIDAGETVAIVGQNGKGKSTIIKLLLGLYQPDSGIIKIGGQPLSTYSRVAREKMFAPVFQDFFKYDITLRENIGIGDVTNLYDEERVKRAIKKARADQIVNRLPKGIDTLLGRSFEGGVDLSGGQWQRVAIARAFMGDQPVMILDEPTSQLDPMVESEVYSDFAKMVEGKTSILITHRLGATTIVDRIMVIENGQICQTGTHQELTREEGIYADMFQAQKQWYIKSNESGGVEID